MARRAISATFDAHGLQSRYMGAGKSLQVRVMTPAEAALALDWAAAEGWKSRPRRRPLLHAVDPDGFLIGELDGAPAAIISTVNYSDNFAFLGFYIVRPDLRGRGLGLAIWRAAMAHAGRRVVGLDGVIAQQDNYRKSGFSLAHRNIRFGGMVPKPMAPPQTVALDAVPFAQICASDATVFPAPRAAFLRVWIARLVMTVGHLFVTAASWPGASSAPPSAAGKSVRWSLTMRLMPRSSSMR